MKQLGCVKGFEFRLMYANFFMYANYFKLTGDKNSFHGSVKFLFITPITTGIKISITLYYSCPSFIKDISFCLELLHLITVYVSFRYINKFDLSFVTFCRQTH